jgi:hypothetical protein
MAAAKAQIASLRGSSLQVPPSDPNLGGNDVGKSGSAISAIAWVPQEELDPQAWASAGRRLGAIGRGSQWWVGDWIRYGTARWGEKYVDAARITSYDVHTLRNLAYVASCFDLSLRRDNLSWSHHALLAAFSQDEQQHWLNLATAEKLSVADLRVELRASRKANGGSLDPVASEKRRGTILCPECGHKIDMESIGGQEE